MAASNYTANIKLNQWAAGDYVLREDFNSDNLKIDQALAAADQRIEDALSYADQKIDQALTDVDDAIAAVGLTLLYSTVTTEDAERLEIDVSTIDWAQYSHVIVETHLMGEEYDSCYLRLTNTGGTETYGTCYGLADDSSNLNGFGEVVINCADDDTGITRIEFGVYYNSSNLVVTHIVNSDNYPIWGKSITRTYDDMVTLNFVPSNVDMLILAGSTIRIMGVKQ